jgi:hypothetical protein
MGCVKGTLFDRVAEIDEVDFGYEQTGEPEVVAEDENPFRRLPSPIPFENDPDIPVPRAWDLFTSENLSVAIRKNREWLEAIPRPTNTIQRALFPVFVRAGMCDWEIQEDISAAMFEAGYRPEHQGVNPSWMAPE